MIRRWLLKIARLTLRLLQLTIASCALLAAIATVSIYAPSIHTDILREYVGHRVFYVKSPDPTNRFMGTAFLLKGKDKSYIVTNDHLCDGQVKGRVMVSRTIEGKGVSLRILERSKTSDLCLIEGFKDMEGLSMGDLPYMGQTIYTVGHPALKPLTINSGQINGLQDITTDDDARALNECKLPKNRKIKRLKKDGDKRVVKEVCSSITRNAYVTNAIIFPGSSGSPVVDHIGRVVGVVFATDGTHWALVVSYADLKQLMFNR